MNRPDDFTSSSRTPSAQGHGVASSNGLAVRWPEPKGPAPLFDLVDMRESSTQSSRQGLLEVVRANLRTSSLGSHRPG
eukprot:1490810-Prymnesium_polylepis.1